jgi:hypothetical protein
MPHAALGNPDTRGIRVAVLSVARLTSVVKVNTLYDGLPADPTPRPGLS